jgi:superfamily II DNA or RNA helicase
MDVVASALASLDSLHRDVLVVLAIEAERAVSRTHWQDACADAGVTDDRGRKIYGQAFKDVVDALVCAGAVVRDARGEHGLADGWLAPSLDDAHRRGQLGSIALRLGTSRRHSWHRGLSARGQLLAAIPTNDLPAIRRAETALHIRAASYGDRECDLVAVLGLDIPVAWLARLDDAMRLEYLRNAVALATRDARRLGIALRAAALAAGDETLRARVAILDALAGDGESARAVLEGNGSSQWSRAARGFLALTEGRHSEARELFAAAAVGARGQRVELPDWLAVFDVLLAVTSDRAEEVADVARRIHKAKRAFASHPVAMFTLAGLADFRRSGKKELSNYRPAAWLDSLFVALAQVWMDLPAAHEAELAARARYAEENGYAWLSRELASFAGKKEGTLRALFGQKEGWELALDTLRSAVVDAAPAATGARAKRAKKDDAIWWTITLHPESRWVDVDAAMASRPDLKGKKVSLRRMLEDPDGTPLDEHDTRVAEAMDRARAHGNYLLPCAVLLAMVGHPRVRDAHGRHIRVETAEPRLRVEPTTKGARLRVVPSRFDASGAAAEREDDERVVVYTRTPTVARILDVVTAEGIQIPRKGLARMSEVLGAMGASIGVDAAASLARETSEGDPRIHVQLFRVPSGLRARLRVVPGGASGPALRPGVPPAETVHHESGALVRVVRDLAEERARLERLLEKCPTLASLPLDGDDRVAAEIETCLELLLEVRETEADVVIEWLEGQPIGVPVVRGASQVRVRVRGGTKWLEVEGEVRVDETRVIDMRELLESASRARGRFVPIGDDAWLALTDDLRRKLDALGRLRGLDKDGRIPGALLSGMDDVWDGMDVSFVEEIAKRRAALEAARDRDVAIPPDLGATLRDYQRDGFVFLARRTEAGLGACLADDMGLGKTVQALALLLHRRKRGPALVIAPTSVCRNWENEAARFAPSLAVRRLADGDRASVVTSAERGEIVIASYGLLVAEQELLASRGWGTVIFDEAHALKNASTRRWSAARALESEASVALTGTPVENHAGELHALFDLLVPGMLGSRPAFDRAIGSAIEQGSREAAALLRKLVRPFVLRRTKNEVLAELPPKTEVLHVVPASAEHFAFYEAVRRRALEKMEAAKRTGGASLGRARIEILAELTRLRRAAIDPRLVGGDDAPSGSKIDALAEIVSELRAEGRRALVFSQFLEVLDLARSALEERGVTCRRLDGTMTERARAEEVTAFQAGTADVFLVSLKAGGVGMNLTAADVVILLDPWWNPAVEDQAAGRAHRIGQSKPVTVARIVTEHTIEEKVLALHAKKRKLYDDLVADADGSGTLDVDALTALLSDTVRPRTPEQGTGGQAAGIPLRASWGQ